MRRRVPTRTVTAVSLVSATALLGGLVLAAPDGSAATRQSPVTRPHPGLKPPPKAATVRGRGGAVTSVDADASRIGLGVLRRGGNAVDAAVATAAALGVTEPFSTGVGGGGYFLYYDARTGRVRAIDGRETAPAAMPRNAFINPRHHTPYQFTPERVTSGVSVGTPGTPATWTTALRRWGSRPLSTVLAPAERLARRGFVVDPTFRSQTAQNRLRFRTFTSTRKLYLRGHHLPRVGTRFRNPDLAATYAQFGRHPRMFYAGAVPRQVSALVHHPPLTHATRLPVPRGYLRPADFARYRVHVRQPTHVAYRGYQVDGVAPSTSGGTTVGEALNILEPFDLSAMSRPDALHHYLDAGNLAFADRAAYVGDPHFVKVPQQALLSQRFADERACLIPPARALHAPTAPGDPRTADGRCSGATPQSGPPAEEHEGPETSNLTVTDRWGNVVEYTLTIEQTGGSGIVVPGRGYLLNNELTDFSARFEKGDPNRITPGKRPRSSISPTIVLKHGKPFLALGSPGGATIITTVLQILVNRLDLDMSLPQALAAPRASPENAADVIAEPAFISRYGKALKAYGYHLTPSGDRFTLESQVGAATGIEFGPHGRLTVVAEPTRRGGGSARVLHPR